MSLVRALLHRLLMVCQEDWWWKASNKTERSTTVRKLTGMDKLLVATRQQSNPDFVGVVQKRSNNYCVVYLIRREQDTYDHKKSVSSYRYQLLLQLTYQQKNYNGWFIRYSHFPMCLYPLECFHLVFSPVYCTVVPSKLHVKLGATS